MSELESHDLVDIQDYRGEVYIKSEADKVIANRDYEIEELKKSIGNLLGMDIEQVMKEVIQKTLIYGDGFVPVEHAMKLVAELRHHKAELRHHKCKRCLAMAKECEVTALWCYQAANTLPTGFHATLFGKPVMIEPDRLFNRFELLMKWSDRWMKIAKQFKESK